MVKHPNQSQWNRGLRPDETPCNFCFHARLPFLTQNLHSFFIMVPKALLPVPTYFILRTAAGAMRQKNVKQFFLNSDKEIAQLFLGAVSAATFSPPVLCSVGSILQI